MSTLPYGYREHCTNQHCRTGSENATLECQCGAGFCSEACFIKAWLGGHKNACAFSQDIEAAAKNSSSKRKGTALIASVALSRQRQVSPPRKRPTDVNIATEERKPSSSNTKLELSKPSSEYSHDRPEAKVVAASCPAAFFSQHQRPCCYCGLMPAASLLGDDPAGSLLSNGNASARRSIRTLPSSCFLRELTVNSIFCVQVGDNRSSPG